MPVIQTKQTEKVKDDPPRVDESLYRPGKYEVTPETTFRVQIHLKQNAEGRWQVMNGPGKGIESHELVFRMWTYDEMVDLRKMATSFDTVKRIHMIDNDALNRLKVQRFLSSWTLDRENPRLKLHHVNGVLTDEGWQMFTRLQPNIISFILDAMNAVLEYNG